MKILHLCLGLYNFWTTYEGEYINESLMARSDVQLKIWGRDRMGYVPNLNAVDVVNRLYGDKYPDVVIVHSSMAKHKDKNDRKLLDGMEKLSKHCVVIWRTFDCFSNKIQFYIDQVHKYKPSIVLVWYPGQVKPMVKATGVPTFFFPHSVGRRYYNKNCARPYDIGLIGRCNFKGESLTPKHFDGKVFTPPKRKTRAEKGNNLVNDLNLCRFSWNSPVLGKHTSLRFVESPACGTLSMIPHHFSELDGYFPKDTYVVCNSVKNASKIMKGMPSSEFCDIQQRAYEHIMIYHTSDSRISYLMDIIKGKNRHPFDYRR